MAPKHKYHSTAEVTTASALGVGIFNEGLATFVSKVLGRLGVTVSRHSSQVFEKKDTERRRRYALRSSAEWKKVQKQKRKAQLGIEDELEEQEGDVYEAGGFMPDGTAFRPDVDGEQPSGQPPAKKSRQCRHCKGPVKGHKRGKGCPPYSS